MRHQSRAYPEHADEADRLAAVHERLDALTWQLEQMAQGNAEPRGAQAEERASRISDAMARLDRRLDQVVSDDRNAGAESHRAQYAPPPAAAPPTANRIPASWTAQIAARQRALDGAPAPAAAPVAPAQADASAGHAEQFVPPQRPPDSAPAHGRSPALEAPMPTPAEWSRAQAAQQAHRPHQSTAAHVQHYASTAPIAPTQAHPDPAADPYGLAHELRHLNAQISSLHQPYEQAFHALRDDLADIGRRLADATPRWAIEAFEGQIRGLAERIDRATAAGPDPAVIGALQRDVAEVRNALHQVNPAETLSRFEDALRSIYFKVEQIAGAGQQPQIDPMVLSRLEQAVASLHGVIANAVPEGAIANLAAEMRALSTKVERAAADGSAETLGRLEAQIAALMQGGYQMSPALDDSIRQLAERFDHMQLSQGDQLALGALEDRIVKLSEKLDASNSRLGHLDAIERGLADLLVYLEEFRQGNARASRGAPAEPVSAPATAAYSAPAYSTPPAAAPAYSGRSAATPHAAPMPTPFDRVTGISPAGHTEQTPAPPPALPALAPRAAPVEVEPRPEPVRPPVARTMPGNAQRQPIDPNLPPDTPLEPGSGAPRVKPGSAAARIAASEAALGNARPAAMETGGKSAALAAARNAAKVAYLETQSKTPMSLGQMLSQWLPGSFKKKPKEPPSGTQAAPSLQPAMPASAPIETPSTISPPARPDDSADALPSRRQKILKVLKTLLIAASVVIIVVGVAQTAMEYLIPNTPAGPGALPPKGQSKTLPEPTAQAPATTTPSPQAPRDPSATPAPTDPSATPSAADPDAINSISRGSEFFDPSPASKLPDVTGSISRSPAAPRTSAPGGQSSIDALPDSIGTALRIAAAAKYPAAEYELGVRYADGRGVPQDLQEAARWFGLAAEAGFVPAQFRLGSMNEKGEGIRKDPQAARRLYLAAAAKGHAKAMHNLAVLYAEGIDGKPDYKAASEWFRKAAGYGVTDSQYNLAILFARGIGLQANLGESYRWFALAAANGDRDAAKKRDEVATRLDENTLATLKLAVQAFVPEREPDEATNLGVPPGGWDHPSAALIKPRRPAPTTSAAR